MHGHKSQWKRNEIIKAICLPTSTANPAQNSHKLNMVGCGIWLLNCKSPFILRRQLHESGFFQNCGTFYFDLYWKYHNFERNEICVTVYLRWMDLKIWIFFFWHLWSHSFHSYFFCLWQDWYVARLIFEFKLMFLTHSVPASRAMSQRNS